MLRRIISLFNPLRIVGTLMRLLLAVFGLLAILAGLAAVDQAFVSVLGSPWVAAGLLLGLLILMGAGLWAWRREMRKAGTTRRDRFWFLLLAVLTAAVIVGMPSATGTPLRQTGFGGIETSHKINADDPGPWWAKVTYFGRYPIGMFVDYRLHCKVSWSRGTPYRSIASTPELECGTSDEFNVDISQYKGPMGKFYACKVAGVWRKHGCYYVFAKWKVTVKVPVHGDFTVIYPWIAIWIDGRGDVRLWDYGPKNHPF